MRTIGVRLRLLVDQYKQDGKQAEQVTANIGRKAKVDLDQVAASLGMVGGALLATAGAAVYASATFDKQMSEVKAVSGATADELARLREAAIEAGQATAFSATEAAKAQAELAKAGIATADILGGALTGALSLASAGSLELDVAAEIAAASMNTFGLGGEKVAHIADVLAAASNKSAAGVEDLGLGLQQVGLVAAQTGFTFEETVGLLAAMADRGLKGSDGATSLKTALQRLMAPTDGAATLMQKLGISLYDATGQTVDAANIAGQLQVALQDLAPAQRNAALQTIFGSDAIRAANVLYSEGRAGIEEYVAAVNDHGAASDVASTKMDNLAGDVERLTGSLQTLFITSGSGANGGLRLLAQTAEGLVNFFGKLPPPVLSTLTVIAGLGGAGLLAAAGVLKARSMLLEMQDALGGAETRAGRLTGKLGALAAAAGKVGLVLAAVTFTLHALEELDLLEWVDDVPIVGDAVGALAEMFGATDVQMRAAATSAGKLATREQILTSSMEEQVTAGRKLTDLWEELHGLMASADEKALNANRAIEEIADVFADGTASIKGNSTAVLENRVALEDAARKAAEAAQAYLDHTGDVEGAAEMMARYRGEAVKATGATGQAKEEIAKFAQEIFRLPASRTITIKINTSMQLQRVQSELSRFDAQFRYGGITLHAQSGLLRDAAVFAPQAPARYAFAEPGTGGEAFVPRFGDRGRSLGILSQAASWHGADVVPREGGWYGRGDTYVSVYIGDQELRGMVHTEISEANRHVKRRVGR
jgi:TP901 family phage tail tape measure protein